MRGYFLKTSVLVALWTVMSAAAMLMTFLPLGVLAGLGQRAHTDMGRLL